MTMPRERAGPRPSSSNNPGPASLTLTGAIYKKAGASRVAESDPVLSPTARSHANFLRNEPAAAGTYNSLLLPADDVINWHCYPRQDLNKYCYSCLLGKLAYAVRAGTSRIYYRCLWRFSLLKTFIVANNQAKVEEICFNKENQNQKHTYNWGHTHTQDARN